MMVCVCDTVGIAEITRETPYLSFDADQCCCRMSLFYHPINIPASTTNLSPTSSSSSSSSSSYASLSDNKNTPNGGINGPSVGLLRHEANGVRATSDWRCACGSCRTTCITGSHIPIWFDPQQPDAQVLLWYPSTLPPLCFA